MPALTRTAGHVGQAACDVHKLRGHVYQPIVAWHDRRETTLQPDDPNEEPPADPEQAKVWHLIRRVEGTVPQTALAQMRC
ncbi:hypothetical protein GCM10009679_20970 [Saccharothrix algeriensis]|uniref:Uncharacterized protein n=1 Tax=Catellatospora bangladeshensis TaxID=310355 RepID=A0A8J3NI32_9ACTN|nr:hypothetical protein Cba03nite_33790 [Catellatospora bangladeshensis]